MNAHDRVRDLERQIEELKSRWPAHSVPPAMVQQLDELEEELEMELNFGWDSADANANFPGFYDKIVVLDGLGLADEYMTRRAEEILELFDWTGLEVEFHAITLDRFKGLLKDALSPA